MAETPRTNARKPEMNGDRRRFPAQEQGLPAGRHGRAKRPLPPAELGKLTLTAGPSPSVRYGDASRSPIGDRAFGAAGEPWLAPTPFGGARGDCRSGKGDRMGHP